MCVSPMTFEKSSGKGVSKRKSPLAGEPYSGNIVNMGVKNEDGSVCYIIGVRKDIRAKIGKLAGRHRKNYGKSDSAIKEAENHVGMPKMRTRVQEHKSKPLLRHCPAEH